VAVEWFSLGTLASQRKPFNYHIVMVSFIS
jgi:hypothetical protein